MPYTITLQPSGHRFTAEPDQTLLDAALGAGLHVPYGCRNGACGACQVKLISGAIDHGASQESGLPAEERAAGKLLLCCARARSDLQIECPEARAATELAIKNMPVRVQKLDKLAPDVMRLRLQLPASERLRFWAGQYIEILLADGGRRAFSIANPPQEEGFLELHIRRVPGGKFTEQVFTTLKERDILRIEGPYGNFYLREESERPLLMVAGGTGFAPLKAIIEDLLWRKKRRPIHLYWGSRDRAGLYLHDLAAGWSAQHGHILYVPVLSEPDAQWSGRSGLVHRAVLEDFADLSAFEAYVCGAPAMIEAAKRDFLAARLPAECFHADAFNFAAPVGAAP